MERFGMGFSFDNLHSTSGIKEIVFPELGTWIIQ